jgi:phosphate transport system substrate-binding protein
MVILGQRWAEEYMKRNPGVTVQVTGGGSGTGISALINGTTDIASSSRPMKTAEKTQVSQKAGADAVEIPVAKDGVSVYVHKDNPLTEITFDQLKGVYTGKIASWKDLGGKHQKIVIYSRENSSGTYVFFKEHVLGGTDFAPTAQTLPGTAAVANAISKDRGGIGYGGIAYGEGIKLLPVKRGAGEKAVPASKETIADGSYPLSRPLYFYSRGQPLGAAKAFIDWTLSEEGQGVVEKVGYFPLR